MNRIAIGKLHSWLFVVLMSRSARNEAMSAQTHNARAGVGHILCCCDLA